MAINKAFNFMILLALLLAGLSVFLIIQYVKSVETKAKAAAALTAGGAKEEKVEMVDAFVAKQDIPPGSPITADSVESKKVPAFMVPETSIKSLDETKDLLAAFLIPAGDLILKPKLLTKDELARASLQVEKGKRLVTVSVSDTKANAYMIKNGDLVDILLTTTVKKFARDSTGDWIDASVTKTLLQSIRVFDIQYGTELPEETKSENVIGRKGKGNTATFEVTPEQAEMITNAETNGVLSMVLRRFDDSDIVDSAGYNETMLTKDMVQETPPPPPAPAPVAPAPEATTQPKKFY